MSWRKLRRVSIGQYEPSFRYRASDPEVTLTFPV
jgi:hypothetical protein